MNNRYQWLMMEANNLEVRLLQETRNAILDRDIQRRKRLGRCLQRAEIRYIRRRNIWLLQARLTLAA
jgi:hypothetical protein